MDIAVNKQKKTLFKKIWPIAIVVTIIAIAIKYSAFLLQADIVIDNDTLVYGEVKQGQFSISVRGAGLLVPDKIKWLAASVDGHVERVVVKPGKAVQKGELIIELSNPRLKQLQEETKWELEAMIAESKASKAEQKSGLLFQKARMLDAKLNYKSSQLRLDAQQELFNNKTGAVSKIDYEKTKLETQQFKQRWQIQEEVLRSMTDNIVVQDNARKSRINKMQKTLERAEQQVKDLMIYASLDSVVQDVAVEPGQRVNMGSNLAKLAQQDSLIAELQVAELLIGEVKLGQQVTIDTRNNKVNGVVSRVDPAVVNGNVQVDVTFTEQLPTDARPDLSVDGEIKITDIADTLYVSRPIFSQRQSNSTLYKLSSDGNIAQRTQVRLGKGSSNQIQVIEGLSVGDRIITSDSSSWQTYQKIRIN